MSIEITFDEIVALEPELQRLRNEARAIRDDGSKSGFCANAIWYGHGEYEGLGFKPRLKCLVGWKRREGPEVLKSSEAYYVAYRTIYKELPDCRPGPRCGCAAL
jgi:hypothetical protein